MSRIETHDKELQRICDVCLPDGDGIWASIDIDAEGKPLYQIEGREVDATVYRNAIATVSLSIACLTYESLGAIGLGSCAIIEGKKLKLPGDSLDRQDRRKSATTRRRKATR